MTKKTTAAPPRRLENAKTDPDRAIKRAVELWGTEITKAGVVLVPNVLFEPSTARLLKTTDIALVLHLLALGEAVSLGEIATRLQVAPRTLTRSLKRLTKLGLKRTAWSKSKPSSYDLDGLFKRLEEEAAIAKVLEVQAAHLPSSKGAVE